MKLSIIINEITINTNNCQEIQHKKYKKKKKYFARKYKISYKYWQNKKRLTEIFQLNKKYTPQGLKGGVGPKAQWPRASTTYQQSINNLSIDNQIIYQM